jgi:hypothetical protein
VLISLFICLIPKIFTSIDPEASDSSGGASGVAGILWPLCFMIGFVSKTFLQGRTEWRGWGEGTLLLIDSGRFQKPILLVNFELTYGIKLHPTGLSYPVFRCLSYKLVFVEYCTYYVGNLVVVRRDFNVQ